jgi:hypothetical protein
LASVKLEFAAAITVLALACAFVKAKLALVTARLAIVRLEKADEVALLALRATTLMVEVAESCADLMPLEADIDACWSC